jgi:hypothetical protein
MFLKKYWSNFITSGFLETGDIFVLHQLYLLNFCSVLVAALLVGFGSLHFFLYKNALLGWIEIGVGLVIIGNILLLRISREIDLAKHVFILLGLNTLFILLLTGGIEDTGIFWFFVFPVAAVFLVGLRQGIMWFGIFSLAIVTVVVFEYFDLISLPYQFSVIRQMFFSLLIVGAVAGFVDYTRAKQINEKRIWKV